MHFSKLALSSLFILFAVYMAQEWLYTGGSLFSQLCILTIILISGAYAVKSFLLPDKKNMFFMAWTFFLMINITGFIFKPDLSEGIVRDAIKNTLGCMLPFYPFYYFSKKGILKSVHLIWFSLLILTITIFRYFTYENFLLERSPSEMEVVNNFAYMFVSVLPFIFLIGKKRLVSLALSLLIIVFVIRGAKRGAIIAASIGLIMLFYYQIKTVEKRHRIFGYVSAIVVIIIITAFTYKTTVSNEFMLYRMSSLLEGETSNRTLIYTSIFNNWYTSDNIFNFVFGYGITGSVKLSGGYLAHNDWLELLSNFGLTGVFAYLFLFYSAFKICLTKEWILDKRVLMLTLTLMWLFISAVSMWYTSLDYYMYSILFGYLIGSNSYSLE